MNILVQYPQSCESITFDITENAEIKSVIIIVQYESKISIEADDAVRILRYELLGDMS